MRGSLDGTYGAMGSCWTTTTAAAGKCHEDCEAKLLMLQATHPDAGC